MSSEQNYTFNLYNPRADFILGYKLSFLLFNFPIIGCWSVFAAAPHSAGLGHGCPITVITPFPTYSKLFPPPGLLSTEVGRRECLCPPGSLFISS